MTYSPAVGIPDPAARWNGLDPVDDTRPADPGSWPAAESAGYYYIDNTHPSTADLDNTYGYPNKPRTTMPTTLVAGAVVVLRGGPYAPTNYTSLSWDGTSAAPIWISGDPVNKTEFRNTWRIRTASYLFVENIKWTTKDEDQLDLRPSADGQEIHHVAIRNCEAVGLGLNTGNGTLFASGTTFDMPIHDVVYYQCIARDGGDWQAATENDKHGFGVGLNMHHFWWIQCTGYHLGGDAFGNGHDANHTTFHLYYDSCIAYECRENAIDLKEVNSVVISGCHFYGFAPTDSSEGAAIVIHYGPTTGEGTRDAWIINNRVHDSTYGIVSTETNESWWIGNVVWNCNSGLNPDRGGGNIHLWNNTVYNCATGIDSGGSITSLDLRNNIVVGSSISHLEVDSAAARAASSASNELYFQAGGAVQILWGATYTSVADWIAGTTVGDDSIEDDPLFINAADHDFRLASSSPAIDAGYDWRVSANASFTSIFGFTPVWKDIAGNDRSIGTLDLGAYEFIAYSLRRLGRRPKLKGLSPN